MTLTANELRDRLYDTATASALLRAPIHAAVLHLMDEAARKNPGVLGTQDAVEVMQNVIMGMTNDFGTDPQLTMRDLTSRALPYLQQELSKKLPPKTVNAVQTGWNILVVAEQQGLFSAVYSNLTTAIPSGAIFSDVANTASAIQALQRQAASRVASLALPERIRSASDSAFREAAAQLLSQVTSISPEDALATIVQNVPALRNSPLVNDLAQAAQTAGRVVTDFNSLVTGVTNALGALHQSVVANGGLLGQIAGAQQDIIGSLTNSPVLADAKSLAQQISLDISSNIDTAQNVVGLASTIFKIGGNPQLAERVATVGGASIKVAETVGKIANAIDSADGLFSIAGAAATGNFIGAALDVFSMFGGGSSGPSPDQVILDQIEAVRQDIAALRADMDNRFDRVDAALTNIMETLDYNFSMISNDFNYVVNHLGQIESSLCDLQGQVQRMESETYSYLNAFGDYFLDLALNGGLNYEVTYGYSMDYPTFQNFENTFYTWAYNTSSDALREPTPVNCPSCYTASGLYNQLTTQVPPEQNLGYVNNFIYNTLGLPMPYTGGSALANPRVWSITANAYSQLCMENPGWFRQTAAYRFSNVIGIGYNLNTFLNHLIAFNTNAPNTNLWIAVCNGYRSAAQSFTNAIQGSIANFDATNHLAVGLNPFTDQFLSLVTPQTNTMRDGYYTVAAVVSVSAMACSPTADGMPIYLLDQNALRRLDANGMLTTLAGSSTNSGFRDGLQALFNNPLGLAVGSDGSVYVSDTGNHAIRVWKTTGTVVTVAGYIPGTNNAVPVAGAVDGTNGTARFNSPRGIICDSQGNLLVADMMNHVVRKVTPTGVATTLAGTLGLGGVRDGLTVPAAHGTNGLIAQLWAPDHLWTAASGQVYVIDTFSRKMKVIDTNGVVATVYRPNPLALLFPQTMAGSPAALRSQAFEGCAVQTAMGNSEGVDPNYAVGHSLALKGDGAVAAWGNNSYGQLNVPVSLTNAVALAAGCLHSVALKADGTVVAWGDNGSGQCNVPISLSNIVAVSAGGFHSLALKADGTVVAWGDNGSGQCNVPSGLANVVSIAAAGDPNLVGVYSSGFSAAYSLALTSDGTVHAWGGNAAHTCDVPFGLSNVVAIAGGSCASLGLRGDGTIVAWGTGQYQFAYDYYHDRTEDTGIVTGLPNQISNVVAITQGFSAALALKADGSVVAWGTGTVPANGGDWDIMLDSGLVDAMPTNLVNVVSLACMSGIAEHALAVRLDGIVAAWGYNGSGECNVPMPTLRPQLPEATATNAVVQQLIAGVITPDGRILVADKFGLRLFGYSDRLQRQAAAYLVNDLANTSGNLYQVAKTLKAWHLLLQTLATYALGDALSSDDALHALLFGRDCLVDTDSAVTFLNDLVSKADWRPTQTDLGATALQRVDVLQSRILNAVTQLAQQPNPASLPLVTGTLNRLNLLLATHDQPIPAPALNLAPGTNQTAQVVLNGYPYVHYALQASTDMHTWTNNSQVFRDASSTNVSTVATSAKFFRAVQGQ